MVKSKPKKSLAEKIAEREVSFSFKKKKSKKLICFFFPENKTRNI